MSRPEDMPDDEEYTVDVKEEEKEKDPYNEAFISRTIDGQVFKGKVVNIEEGAITKDRLYRIKYEDGDYEHFTPDMMKQYVVKAVAKRKAASKKIEEAVKPAKRQRVVTLHSLANRPELNGKRGVLGPFDSASQRFPINVEGETNLIAIKPANFASTLCEEGGRKACFARLSKSLQHSKMRVQDVTVAFADKELGSSIWMDPTPGVLFILHNVKRYSDWFFQSNSIAGLAVSQHRHGCRLLAFMGDPRNPGAAFVRCIGVGDGGQRPDTAADYIRDWVEGTLAGDETRNGVPICGSIPSCGICESLLMNDWAESVPCSVCEAVVCVECFSKAFSSGNASCTFCRVGSMAYPELCALADKLPDPSCVVALGRFLKFNHLEDYAVDPQVLKGLVAIRTSDDFLRSDLTMSNQDFEGCLKRCRRAVKNYAGIELLTEMAEADTASSRTWRTQGLRRPLLHCTAPKSESCIGHVFDAKTDSSPWEAMHIAFVCNAQGHVLFMPELQFIDIGQVMDEPAKPRSQCLTSCHAFMDREPMDHVRGFKKDVKANQTRLQIAERIFKDRSTTFPDEPLQGRRLLMRVMADIYVGRDNKRDSIYLERKVARQKEIVREFDSPEVRQYLLRGHEHTELDQDDLAEELDWISVRAMAMSSEFHANGTFWQMVRKARQEINHESMGAIQRCRVCWKETGKKCTGCGVAYYCCPECSKKDWKLHKSECKLYGQSSGGAMPPRESSISKQPVAPTMASSSASAPVIVDAPAVITEDSKPSAELRKGKRKKGKASAETGEGTPPEPKAEVEIPPTGRKANAPELQQKKIAASENRQLSAEELLAREIQKSTAEPKRKERQLSADELLAREIQKQQEPEKTKRKERQLSADELLNLEIQKQQGPEKPKRNERQLSADELLNLEIKKVTSNGVTTAQEDVGNYATPQEMRAARVKRQLELAEERERKMTEEEKERKRQLELQRQKEEAEKKAAEEAAEMERKRRAEEEERQRQMEMQRQREEAERKAAEEAAERQRQLELQRQREEAERKAAEGAAERERKRQAEEEERQRQLKLAEQERKRQEEEKERQRKLELELQRKVELQRQREEAIKKAAEEASRKAAEEAAERERKIRKEKERQAIQAAEEAKRRQAAEAAEKKAEEAKKKERKEREKQTAQASQKKEPEPKKSFALVIAEASGAQAAARLANTSQAYNQVMRDALALMKNTQAKSVPSQSGMQKKAGSTSKAEERSKRKKSQKRPEQKRSHSRKQSRGSTGKKGKAAAETSEGTESAP